MKTPKINLATVLYASLGLQVLTACSTAQFAGSSAQRAVNRSTPTATNTSQTPTPTEVTTATETSPETVVSTSTASESTEVTDTDTSTETITDPEVTSTATATATTTESATSTSTDITVEPPRCETNSVGVQLAFLIDNSQSNEANDCPSPDYRGQIVNADGTGRGNFRCLKSTSREKAVLASYDMLQNIAQAEPSNALATSSLAIVSFPVKVESGYAQRLSWTTVTPGNRYQVEGSMLFSREPFGQTPYGDALLGASELFASSSNDDRAKVAILVTDGEPTDQNPSAALAKAQALRDQGITVYTVLYAGADRASRHATHQAMLQKFDNNRLSWSGKHWYDESVYSSFASYVDAILGNATLKSLAEQIGGGSIIEVADAKALENALSQVVKKAIRCEP